MTHATKIKAFFGYTFWQYQLVLAAIALAVSGMYWLILGSAQPRQALFFALIIGNSLALARRITSPFYERKVFPWDCLAYLAVLIPVGAVSSVLSSVLWKLMASRGAASVLPISWDDMRVGTFVAAITTVSFYVAAKNRANLEARNRELENQVTLGQIQLRTQEAELKAAHEIQAHLLPREIPQLKGFQISCAWQPAQSVGGDYFDVLTLAPGQIGVCLADVSGKGITAALLMANLQAIVRAFAPDTRGPGALCTKINEVLCSSIAPGKFVTLFFGIIDSETMTLRFENAGHCAPIVLRGDSAIELTEGSTVLGLFPGALFEDRLFTLQSGDCVLLTTDGVTEAGINDESVEKQFGAERVTESAKSSRSLGAHGIRTCIIEDVSRFCNGNFHDDASLIVVTVD